MIAVGFGSKLLIASSATAGRIPSTFLSTARWFLFLTKKKGAEGRWVNEITSH
jgi:hypothetical protein